jgi:uncharacterized protein
MIEEIAKLVEETCRMESNLEGYGAWSHHIAIVVKNAKKLARMLKADEEIVVISALLHDYASVLNRDWQTEHHVHGAKLARVILQQYSYPEDKIEKVVHCILTHWATEKLPRETLESEIVASADAMTHIQNAYELLHYAYAVRRMEIDEGAAWVLTKVRRSWKKLVPEAKKLVLEKYNAAEKMLDLPKTDKSLNKK